MPDWRRIIVGDAFRLPSREFNYYRDFALVWPFVVFSIVSVMQLFSRSRSPEDTVFFHRALAAALICLLLAKERLPLIGAALALLFGRGLLPLIGLGEWRLAVYLLPACAGAIGVAIAKERAGWHLSYEIPDELTVVEFLLGAFSLLLTVVLALWMQKCPPIKYF